MENSGISVGVLFGIIVLIIRIIQTSSWFRMSEDELKNYYEKSTRIFSSIKTNKDFYKFRKSERFQFFFYIFMLVLLIVIYVI